MIKSLVYFLSTVTEALPLVDFVGGGAPGLYNVRDDSGYFPGITTRTGNSIQFKYDQNFWSRIPEYVISLQRYSNAAFERVFCNQEAYTRGLVHLCLTNASSETGFQTQLTNCIFPIVTRAELERLSNTALEMSVFMLYILKSQLPSLDRSISYNTMELMARSVQESMKLMTEHESVNRNHTRPTRGNASVLTRLNQPSVRRDDEERDASSFLQFMKQVLPAAR